MRRRIGWLLALVPGSALVVAGFAPGPPKPDIAHGKRLAYLGGCISCHGEKIDGHLFEEDPNFAIAWSANLSRTLPGWSDLQIERTLRTGRRPDGSALWFMPAYAHAVYSPADMRDLIGWLRTVPPSGVDHPPMKRGPAFADAVAKGMDDAPTELARLRTRTPAKLGPAMSRGRYLAQVACAECHGPDLHGARIPAPGRPPDLRVAAAYDLDQFRDLVRTGRGPGNRDLGDMTRYGPERLIGLTDREIDDIYRYLVARAKAAAAS